jgi:hypothetical protein
VDELDFLSLTARMMQSGSSVMASIFLFFDLFFLKVSMNMQKLLLAASDLPKDQR